MSLRAKQAAETREKVLHAATIEFGQRGFKGARLRQVAERAGIPSPLIHHYFPSKDDLYDAVLARAAERMLAEIDHALTLTRETFQAGFALAPRGNALKDTVRGLTLAFYDALCNFFVEHASMLSMLRNEDNAKAEHVLLPLVSPMFVEVCTQLDALKSAGLFRVDMAARELCLAVISIAAFPVLDGSFVRALSPELMQQECRKHYRVLAGELVANAVVL
jgi:AcrR family transcriptional regulator